MAKPRRGFTFIELLLAMLIFSIVAVSIYLSFNVGIRAWRKGEESYRARQGVRYLLGNISRELRNAVNSKDIVFSGQADSVSFCKASNGLFKVSYEFMGEEGAVDRVLWTYKEQAAGLPGMRSRLASEVTDLKLQYSYKNEGKIEWYDTWEETKNVVPFAVKLSLAYKPGGAAEPEVVSQTVIIPTGTLKEKGEE